MLNLDPAKLAVICVLALIVMGPEKLPGVARQLGHAWKTLTTYREQAEEEIRKAIPNLDLPRTPRNPSAAASHFFVDLINPKSVIKAVSPQSQAHGDLVTPQPAVEQSGFRTAGSDGSNEHEYSPSGSGNQDPGMN